MDALTVAVITKIADVIGKIIVDNTKRNDAALAAKVAIKVSAETYDSAVTDIYNFMLEEISNHTSGSNKFGVIPPNLYSTEYANIYQHLMMAVWLERSGDLKSALSYYVNFYKLGKLRLLSNPTRQEVYPVDYRMRLAIDMDFFGERLSKMGILRYP